MQKIRHDASKSWYEAVAANEEGFEGKDAHCIVIDELHVWKNKRQMFNAARYAGAARDQSLILTISTAGIYDPLTIGYEQYLYAKSILEGTHIDNGFFA